MENERQTIHEKDRARYANACEHTAMHAECVVCQQRMQKLLSDTKACMKALQAGVQVADDEPWATLTSWTSAFIEIAVGMAQEKGLSLARTLHLFIETWEHAEDHRRNDVMEKILTMIGTGDCPNA